jgi:hypothetical protein
MRTIASPTAAGEVLLEVLLKKLPSLVGLMAPNGDSKMSVNSEPIQAIMGGKRKDSSAMAYPSSINGNSMAGRVGQKQMSMRHC